MRIISYSDLHLEFGTDIRPPKECGADVMILAGDIITLGDYDPLDRFLAGWRKPVLYVTGNHEYYTRKPMNEETARFRKWLADKHPNVSLLVDEAVAIDGVRFFGGTMWTYFDDKNQQAMKTAASNMNDFRLIKTSADAWLKPEDTIALHEVFIGKLRDWFDKGSGEPHVVITHHAPVLNPRTKHKNSPLMPAFNSLDMPAIIEKYRPILWIYGHTHECDDQMLGTTRVVSNQLGYPTLFGGHECDRFDLSGLPANV